MHYVTVSSHVLTKIEVRACVCSYVCVCVCVGWLYPQPECVCLSMCVCLIYFLTVYSSVSCVYVFSSRWHLVLLFLPDCLLHQSGPFSKHWHMQRDEGKVYLCVIKTWRWRGNPISPLVCFSLSVFSRRSEGNVRVHGPTGGSSVWGGAAAERDQRGRLCQS